MKKHSLLLVMASLVFSGCVKEPMPSSMSVVMSQAGDWAWAGVHLDKNLPSLCTSVSGTQSKLQLLARAVVHMDKKRAERRAAWVRTSTAVGGTYYDGSKTMDVDCSRFNISVREKTYDTATSKFVLGNEIATVDNDCTVTLTATSKPRSIYVSVQTNFTSEMVFPEVSVPVTQGAGDLFVDCGP